MRLVCVVIFLAFLAAGLAKDCPVKKSNSKLFCYYSKLTEIDCSCSHVILPVASDVKAVEKVRLQNKGVKILVTVNEFNQGLIDLLKHSKIDGLEINLKKLDSKNDINDFISTVRSKFGSDLYVALSVPTKGETLAKYYDFKGLSKHADVFILQTAFLGASKNVTFHPSRLSGLWDMQNTDSIVDLVSGLGAPLSKLVIAAPVQAFHFTLQNEKFSAPGSPALELKSLTRDELCETMNGKVNWTLERDQDQAGPYIFRENKWIAFEDASSIDIKAKYSRVRGLAGLALKDVSQDGGEKCGPTILQAAYEGLSRQARAPRGAVLHSLEREILESSSRPVDGVQLSPYRITRVIDVEGHVHVIRQDTRTEFSCSRQGYFVHPLSCNRFYRCVKFDQRTDEYSVFEFDCPAGLAFDERVEVCVWPGSLPEGKPCKGSSEIAPVPKERFVCPHDPGYYADPENCRWFFACMDQGEAILTAYEFRCPYGLVFDSGRLLCEWPWLVPTCGSGHGLGINIKSEFIYGGPAVALDQYDGLGTLGAVKLGGLSGTIHQPIVYSNVGTLGYNNGVYNNGLGSLALNARLSLQNAGLLKTNLASGYDSSQFGTVSGGAAGSNYQHNSGNLNNQYYSNGASDSTNLNGYYGSGQYQNVGAINSQIHGLDNSNLNSQFAANLAQGAIDQSFDAKSSLDATRYNFNTAAKTESNQGQFSNAQYQAYGDQHVSEINAQIATNLAQNERDQYSSGIGTNTLLYQTNLGQSAVANKQESGEALLQLNLGTLEQASGYGAKSSSNFAQYQGQIGIAAATGSNTQASNFAESAGATSSQSFTQYHGKENSIDNSGLQYQGLNAAQYETNQASNYAGASGATASKTTDYYGNGIVVGNAGADVIGDLNTVKYQSNQAATHSGASGATSSQSFAQYHGKENAFENTGAQYQGLNAVRYETNQAPNYAGASGATAYQTTDYYGNGIVVGNDGADVSGGLNTVKYQSNQAATYSGASGATSSQSFTQYHNNGNAVESSGIGANYIYNAEKAFENNQREILDNVNIVGGGYSAVGAVKSGVQVTNNGDNYAGIVHSTLAPVTVTTYSSVPTVTSVPLPALKTASAFEDYNGGVIANVPQLQYTVQDGLGLANVSTNFVKFVSTTPSPQLVNVGFQQANVKEESHAGYNTGSSFSYQTSYTDNGGYVYPKPSIAFNEGAVNTYTVSTTAKPAVAYVPQPTVPVNENGGYFYPKPSFSFEETPIKTVSQAAVSTFSYSTPTTVKPVSVQPIITVQPTSAVRPAITQPVGSYYYEKQASVAGGYKYEKPAVVFQEPQPQVVVSSYNEGSTFKPILKQPQVFVSSTVAPLVEQKVIVQPASSFSYTKNEGYVYQKPSVAFKEVPVVQESPKIISRFRIRKPIQQTYVQPDVSTYTYQKQVDTGYRYENPSLVFDEKPIQPVAFQQPIVHQTFVQPTVAAQVVTYQQPTVNTFVQPVVQNAQPVVSSYYYQKPAVSTYTYKDVVKQAVVKPVSTYLPVTESPPVIVHQPAVVTSYNYINFTTPKPIYLPAEKQHVVTSYITPTTPKRIYLPPSTVQPTVIVKQPAIISSYHYVNPTTPKPIYLPPSKVQPVVSNYNYVTPTTPRPAYLPPSTVQPAVVSSYSYVAPSTPKPDSFVQEQSHFEFKGYDYPKPSVTFVEESRPIVTSFETRQPVEEVPFIKKKAYVTGQNKYQYNIDNSFKPVVAVDSTPVVVENYQAAKANAFSQSVDTSSAYFNSNYKSETYPTQEVFVQSTPKSVYTSTIAPILPSQSIPVTNAPNYYFYDSRLSNAPKEIIRESYSQSDATSSAYVNSNYQAAHDVYVQSTPKPTYSSTIATILASKATPVTEAPNYYFFDSRLSSTPKPIIKEGYSYPKPTIAFEEAPVVTKTYLPPTKEYLPVTTSRPIVQYSFSSLDDQYQHVSTPVSSTTPIVQKYLPAKTRVRVTTAPTYAVPEVTRTYIPIRSRVRYTTELPQVTYPSTTYLPVKIVSTPPPIKIATLSKEYLPVRSRIRVTTAALPEDLEFTTRKPAKVVKIVRPNIKTIIKQNDIHPILSAKLGAQCTCVSNNLNLRKKQKIIIVEDDDDDDGYVVDNNDQQGAVIENYQYEPQRTVDITPTPQVYFQSSTINELVAPTPTYALRKRVKVASTPTYEPVTEIREVFVKKNITPAPSDKEIADAVRTGLNLVKQAAKEGAREGAEDAINNSRVRESIECQRAGLFRHPNQCNKFYACRWDCTKNKYTLHVFKCPVHLTFDNSLGACNWPSQGPACTENTLLPSE